MPQHPQPPQQPQQQPPQPQPQQEDDKVAAAAEASAQRIPSRMLKLRKGNTEIRNGLCYIINRSECDPRWPEPQLIDEVAFERNRLESLNLQRLNPDIIERRHVKCICTRLLDLVQDWYVHLHDGTILCNSCARCFRCMILSFTAGRKLNSIDGLVLCNTCMLKYGRYRKPKVKLRVQALPRDLEDIEGKMGKETAGQQPAGGNNAKSCANPLFATHTSSAEATSETTEDAAACPATIFAQPPGIYGIDSRNISNHNSNRSNSSNHNSNRSNSSNHNSNCSNSSNHNSHCSNSSNHNSHCSNSSNHNSNRSNRSGTESTDDRSGQSDSIYADTCSLENTNNKAKSDKSVVNNNQPEIEVLTRPRYRDEGRRPLRLIFYPDPRTEDYGRPDYRFEYPPYLGVDRNAGCQVCPECSKPALTDALVVTGCGHVYHEKSFRCTNCKRPMYQGYYLPGVQFESCDCAQQSKVWCTAYPCRQARLAHHEEKKCRLEPIHPGGRPMRDVPGLVPRFNPANDRKRESSVNYRQQQLKLAKQKKQVDAALETPAAAATAAAKK